MTSRHWLNAVAGAVEGDASNVGLSGDFQIASANTVRRLARCRLMRARPLLTSHSVQPALPREVMRIAYLVQPAAPEVAGRPGHKPFKVKPWQPTLMKRFRAPRSPQIASIHAGSWNFCRAD